MQTVSFPRFSLNCRYTPSNARSCLPVGPLAPFVRMRRREPEKPRHKLRGSWPSPPLRCRGPPSLRWRPRGSTFAPGRGQTPLTTPRPYSTPGSPSPRPLPTGPAQPLAPPRPTARSLAQQVPRTRPPPPRPGRSGRASFPPPAAPRPRIHVLLRHPTRPGPDSARAQATGVPGSVRCTATHPALAWVLAWPAACNRRSGPGGRSGSRSRCWPRSGRRCRVSPRGLGPRKIRTRAGWGPRKASFFIFPPPPPQGRTVPPPPTAPPSPGQSPRPLSQLCSSPRRRGSGRRGRRREVAGVLGSGRWAQGGHVGEEGKKEEEGGAGLQFSGLPLPARGKPEPRRAAADPALATGEEQSHLPLPAPGSRKGGGRATPLEVGDRAFFARALCVILSPFRLSVVGERRVLHAWGGALAGRPAPLPAPHFPNPGDLGAGLQRSGTEAARGSSPSPSAEVGQVLGKGKCRGSLPRLASPGRPTLRGNLLGCKPPGLQTPWVVLQSSSRPGRGGISGAEARVRGPREEGGGGGKVCKGGCLQDLGLKTWFLED